MAPRHCEWDGMKTKREELAAFLKALSDPTRLRLVMLLGQRGRANRAVAESGHGPLCVNALAEKLRLTQSAVSQHLRVLRHAGLVRSVRRGAFVHYSIDKAEVARRVLLLKESIGVGRE